jgi:hypothetical protein
MTLLTAASAAVLFWQAAMTVPVLARTSDRLPVAQPPSQQDVYENKARLPLTFEPNEGQAMGMVRYIARCPGAALYFHDDAVDFVIRSKGAIANSASEGLSKMVSETSEQVRMRIVGARPFPNIEPIGKLPGKINYFKGIDPSLWRTGIPIYRQVKYTAVYPGIDLVFYGNPYQLEYDFIVHPGADPSQIRIAFDGAVEGEAAVHGALVLVTPGGARVVQHKPVVYQEASGRRETLQGDYRSYGGGLYGFEVAAYDAARPLVIDPGFQFSSYIGGSDEEWGVGEGVRGIAVGADGSVSAAGPRPRTFPPSARSRGRPTTPVSPSSMMPGWPSFTARAPSWSGAPSWAAREETASNHWPWMPTVMSSLSGRARHLFRRCSRFMRAARCS